MPSFYTVDRFGSLREGLILGLTRYDDIQPNELQQHVDAMFPDGVTPHGERYFLKNTSTPHLASPNIELLFEYVRRAFYVTRPSRFQSFFGCEKEQQAVAFRQRFGKPDNAVWEVQAHEFLVADMNLLMTGTSILVYSYFAHKYWRGEASQDPFWEVLLVPPVTVVRRAL